MGVFYINCNDDYEVDFFYSAGTYSICALTLSGSSNTAYYYEDNNLGIEFLTFSASTCCAPVTPTPTPSVTKTINLSPTPSPTQNNCECYDGVILDNNAFGYTDCSGILITGGAEFLSEVCVDITKSFSSNIQINNISQFCICIAPTPTPTPTRTQTVTPTITPTISVTSSPGASLTPTPTRTITPTPSDATVYNYYTFTPCSGGASTDFRSTLSLALFDVYAFGSGFPTQCYTITSITAPSNTNDLGTINGPTTCDDNFYCSQI